MEPSDPHDLRNTEDAAIETERIAIDGLGEEDSVSEAVHLLRKVRGVREVHGENASGILTVTFDARQTHVPALHDALIQGGYKAARTTNS